MVLNYEKELQFFRRLMLTETLESHDKLLQILSVVWYKLLVQDAYFYYNGAIMDPVV